jgi:hypothetical protein
MNHTLVTYTVNTLATAGCFFSVTFRQSPPCRRRNLASRSSSSAGGAPEPAGGSPGAEGSDASMSRSSRPGGAPGPPFAGAGAEGCTCSTTQRPGIQTIAAQAAQAGRQAGTQAAQAGGAGRQRRQATHRCQCAEASLVRIHRFPWLALQQRRTRSVIAQRRHCRWRH